MTTLLWTLKKCFLFTSLFVLGAIAVRNAYGQSVKGTLAGTVTDTSGAVVSGAHVTAVNNGSGEKFETVTTSSGDYRFPEVSLGLYTVTVASQGFKSAQYDGVRVNVNTVTTQDVTLAIGEVNDTVTVQANALTLQTETSEIGGTVGTKEIVELPLALGGVGALRSPQGFMFLLPGNTGPGAATSSNGANNTNGVNFNKIGGGQNFGAEILVDGASQSRTNNGSNFDEESPSVEALQEFKTTNATPSAEFGRTTGGVMSFATKSGTSRFHGTVFDIFRNDVLDANQWFNNGRGVRRPNDKQNDYGGSLGGPVNIPHLYSGSDRTLFQFTWEQFRWNIGSSVTSNVPTQLERQGDFSESLNKSQVLGTNPCDGTPIYGGQIFDPSTAKVVGGVTCRTAFPNNKILGAPSAAAQALLKYYPLPQNGQLINNFTYSASSPLVNTTFTVRIDESIGSRDHVFLSYTSRQNTRRSGPQTLPDPVDPGEFQQNFITHFGRGGWDHTFSPTLLNHLNVGANRAVGNNFAMAALGNVNYSAQLGIGNIVSTNFPVTNVNDASRNIVQLGNGTNNRRADNSILVADSLNWQRGRHSFKFGVDVRYFQLTSLSAPSPSFSFSRNQTAAEPGTTFTANTGLGLASLYLGLPQTSGTQLFPSVPKWLHWYYGAFVQDDFKVTKELTLNLGLRYDIETPRYEARGQSSNFDLATNDPSFNVPGALIFGSNCKCDSSWLHTWKKDIGPRVGFAYTPDVLKGKITLHGGGAILYGPLQYFDSGSNMQAGYSASPSVTSVDNFSPNYKLDSGFPAFSAPPNLNPSFYDGQAVNANFIMVKNARTSTIYMWSAQVQQQITSDTILSVGYSGQHGTSLPSAFASPNNIPKSAYALGNALSSPFKANTVGVQAPFVGFTTLFPTATVAQALRPYAQYVNINASCCFENFGQSNYNALLVSLNKQFHSGLHYLVSYTWQKNLTDADSGVPGNNAGVVGVQDPTNLRGEKALSVQDVPHMLVSNYLYELPFGRKHLFFSKAPKTVDLLIGGWQIGGIQRYQSGIPYSFACATAIPGTNTCTRYSFTGAEIASAAAKSGTLNPLALASNGKAVADPSTNSLFNGAAEGSQTAALQTRPAFYDPNLKARGTGAYQLGNVPRVTSIVRLNPFFNEDFSLMKTTPITEAVNFILKIEALNAFNRHAWARPGLDPNGVQFGVPTDTITKPRNLQLTARISF